MARPRIFISSTFFDLKHIRKNLELFVTQMGYEPVLFESGDIPFQPHLPLDLSCYAEIDNCHIQILIIGGRYGAPATEQKDDQIEQITSDHFDFYNSITKTEYLKARTKGIPVFIFVQKGVLAEYETYKKNRDFPGINYAHVDNVNIFRLIDEIYNERAGNFVKEFDNFDDIQNWLKDQWAGLFSTFLSQKSQDHQIMTLTAHVDQLSQLVASLSDISEAIAKKVKVDDFNELMKRQEALKKRQRVRLNSNLAAVLNETGITSSELIDAVGTTDTYDELIAKLRSIEDQPILFDSKPFKVWTNGIRRQMELPYFKEVPFHVRDDESPNWSHADGKIVMIDFFPKKHSLGQLDTFNVPPVS